MDVPEYHLKLRVVLAIEIRHHLLIRSLFGDQDAVVFDGILHLLACPAQPLPHFSPEQIFAIMIPPNSLKQPERLRHTGLDKGCHCFGRWLVGKPAGQHVSPSLQLELTDLFAHPT